MTHEDLGRDAAYARARDGFSVNSSYAWGYADALDGVRAAIAIGAVVETAVYALKAKWASWYISDDANTYLTPEEAALPISTAVGERE